ncbi:Ca-activated chloride channel family protein [Parelusimicrobium proximum]|uniref:vWA domain-containing protein n=1 Tax=Parelusimicrobium proximum TaxID=3228953 RepID=UPI003D170F40
MSLFRYPEVFLWALGAALVCGALWYLGARRKRNIISSLFSKENYELVSASFSAAGMRWRDILFVSGALMCIIALAGPQIGMEPVQESADTSYTVIAVDVSSSMKARDLKPSRIDNSKTMLRILADNMKGERVGIVAFTSEAYIQCPITSDTGAVKSFIRALQADMLRAKGTSIGRAVELSVKMLAKYPGKKAIVLLTDGEDHDPDEIKKAVNLAKENNIKIIAVGIGSTEGELIPESVQGGQVTDYKKDKDGKTVVTKLNEKVLIDLASATGGVYIKYTTYHTVSAQIIKALEDLDKQSRMGAARNIYKNRYVWPLAAGIILILASLVIPTKKVKLK